MHAILARLITWPLLALLAIPACALGLAVIVRDVWVRRRRNGGHLTP
jgi:hypothetical protein